MLVRASYSDLSSIYGKCQIYIIKKVPRIENSYRISNLYLGKFNDSRDGIDRYAVFQSHDTISDAIWNRQNYIEYAYHQNALWYLRKEK